MEGVGGPSFGNFPHFSRLSDCVLIRAKRVGFFQIRVGSGSGIGKNFGFGSGSGSGSGIGTVFFINRVLSGNENIDRVFSGISISRLRFQN